MIDTHDVCSANKGRIALCTLGQLSYLEIALTANLPSTSIMLQPLGRVDLRATPATRTDIGAVDAAHR